MKKFNPELLFSVFVLTFFMTTTKLHAQMSTAPSAPPSAKTTTTAGAAPTSTAGAVSSSTSGMYQPAPQAKMQTGQGQQMGAATNSNQPGTVTEPGTATGCINSGILGARCGVKAIQFCKQNPQNPDCQKIINNDNLTK
ncbi:MAG: hypothetical protein ACXVLQ_01175 [Bacteriovorax sp.]